MPNERISMSKLKQLIGPQTSNLSVRALARAAERDIPIVVLKSEFWLQSMKTLPFRTSFDMSATTSFGISWATSSATLLKVPRRMRFRVISAKNRSTMLSQEPEVGVKWR